MPEASGAWLEYEVLPGGAVMTTVRGEQSGATVALLGGVHGDEDEGVLAVWRVVRELEGAALRGVVRAVAPANPSAWAARSRFTPYDGGDLARAFPGSDDGGPTSTLAGGIADNCIDGADLLIDLHSAGVRYSMPLFCGLARGSAQGPAIRAALAFGAPLIWLHDACPAGRSLSAAIDRGIPAMYVECGGGGGIRLDDLDAYVTGVLSVLADLGMASVGPQTGLPAPPQWVCGSGDLDAGVRSTCAGLFSVTVAAGELIPGGGEVGRLFGYEGQLLEVVRAPSSGVVMFLRQQARTLPGDILFVLASPCDGP